MAQQGVIRKGSNAKKQMLGKFVLKGLQIIYYGCLLCGGGIYLLYKSKYNFFQNNAFTMTLMYLFYGVIVIFSMILIDKSINLAKRITREESSIQQGVSIAGVMIVPIYSFLAVKLGGSLVLLSAFFCPLWLPLGLMLSRYALHKIGVAIEDED